MEWKFTRFEVESLINKTLAYGDEVKIAERTGRSASIYSQMFNQDDDRESNFHKVLQEICAEIDIDQTRGITLLCLFNSFVERHIISATPLNVNHELDKADKEFTDIWKSRLKGKSQGEQLNEIEQAIAQLQLLKRAVASEQTRELIKAVYLEN